MEPCKSSVAVLCIVAALIAAARSGDSTDPELNPHSLYMKRLREHLSDSNLNIPDTTGSGSVEGKLVATSIETMSSGGRGKSRDTVRYTD